MLRPTGIIRSVTIQENVDLKQYSTMRLGGKARYLAEANSEDDVKKLADWVKNKSLSIITIGQGSNVVWRDEGFDGLIIVNKITGRKVLDDNNNSTQIEFGAGENWDAAVAWTVDKNLSGLEFLSLIPGMVGGAPVQNIGAYGAELAEVFVSLRAYDTVIQDFVTLEKRVCGFSYRSSCFKTIDKHRYIITSVILNLSKSAPKPPFYEALEKYFAEHKINDYSPQSIRRTVIAIRNSKLPNPAKVANNGSFFTNPIIDKGQFEKLKEKYPDIKGWPTNDKVKIAAGWLVEKAGFKDIHDQETGMATWPSQALVLVNEHAKNTSDLLVFKQKILAKVHEMFGIVLEQEPELLP